MKNWKSIFTIVIFITGFLLLSGFATPKYGNVRKSESIQNPRLFTLSSDNLPTFTEKFNELKTETIMPGTSSSTRKLLPGQKFKATYRGWLASSGEIFDQSLSLDGKNGVVSFSPENLIAGFQQGVVGMELGEIRRIFVPSSLGYGEEQTEKIPANSDLIFDVELISF